MLKPAQAERLWRWLGFGLILAVSCCTPDPVASLYYGAVFSEDGAEVAYVVQTVRANATGSHLSHYNETWEVRASKPDGSGEHVVATSRNGSGTVLAYQRAAGYVLARAGTASVQCPGCTLGPPYGYQILRGATTSPLPPNWDACPAARNEGLLHVIASPDGALLAFVYAVDPCADQAYPDWQSRIELHDAKSLATVGVWTVHFYALQLQDPATVQTSTIQNFTWMPNGTFVGSSGSVALAFIAGKTEPVAVPVPHCFVPPTASGTVDSSGRQVFIREDGKLTLIPASAEPHFGCQ